MRFRHKNPRWTTARVELEYQKIRRHHVKDGAEFYEVKVNISCKKAPALLLRTPLSAHFLLALVKTVLVKFYAQVFTHRTRVLLNAAKASFLLLIEDLLPCHHMVAILSSSIGRPRNALSSEKRTQSL